MSASPPPPKDPNSESRPDASPDARRDELVRAVSADGSVAVRALVAKRLVSEARQRHDLAPTATNALGRALMGGLLIAAGAEDGESLQIQFRGDGPLHNMMVIANSEGRVRGMVGNPRADLPTREGSADVGHAVGRGELIVVRSHASRGEPYSGIVPLESGEVARDLAHYLLQSEQTASAIGLGVATGADGGVEAAGGFLVQALPDPGANEAVLARIEQNVNRLGSTAERVRAGARAEDLLGDLMEGVGYRQALRSEPRYHCPCARARVQQTVMLLGREEIDELIARSESVEVRCEFCAERYEISAQELVELIAEA